MYRTTLPGVVCLLSLLGLLPSAALVHGAEPGHPATALPMHLSQTGLYVPGSTTQVRADNLPFSPQYPLWSDGATKRRWLHIPRGTFIDASQPDAWEFPRGTRLWKEFSQGRRIETRLIERLHDGTWTLRHLPLERGRHGRAARAGSGRTRAAGCRRARGTLRDPVRARLPCLPRGRDSTRARCERAAALRRSRPARAARRASSSGRCGPADAASHADGCATCRR